MSTLDLRAELKHLIDAEQNPSVLEALRTLLTHPQQDWWDTISAEERAEIEQGIAEADRGEFISREEVMKNPKQWL
jgi:predicted transcriptional regulator